MKREGGEIEGGREGGRVTRRWTNTRYGETRGERKVRRGGEGRTGNREERGGRETEAESIMLGFRCVLCL